MSGGIKEGRTVNRYFHIPILFYDLNKTSQHKWSELVHKKQSSLFTFAIKNVKMSIFIKQAFLWVILTIVNICKRNF